MCDKETYADQMTGDSKKKYERGENHLPYIIKHCKTLGFLLPLYNRIILQVLAVS